jgi:hypothetical protein
LGIAYDQVRFVVQEEKEERRRENRDKSAGFDSGWTKVLEEREAKGK